MFDFSVPGVLESVHDEASSRAFTRPSLPCVLLEYGGFFVLEAAVQRVFGFAGQVKPISKGAVDDT